MKQAKIVKSSDAVTVIFKGDITNPEPQTGIIKFPGGHVEVTRTTDNQYWAHISIGHKTWVTDSRIDYDREGWLEQGIPEIPRHDSIEHIAIKINAPQGHTGNELS